MKHSRSILQTAFASRHIKRLCKHWAHRFPVHFDEQHGHIDFDSALHGASCDLQATPNALHIVAIASADDISKLEIVIADHLLRFMSDDEKAHFAWDHVLDGRTDTNTRSPEA
ncbi:MULTISPECIES: DUF2218 domain-containing protein [Pseudomonas fluorescens group]